MPTDPIAFWDGSGDLPVVGRVVVEGDLVLREPAHLGNGDRDGLLDLSLLTDTADGRTPLLTGASLAGALRAHLRSLSFGDRARAQASECVPTFPPEEPDRRSEAWDPGLAVRLLGGVAGDENGPQSPLVVADAYGAQPTAASAFETRDGVRLDPKTRTAEDQKLFDLACWPAGTRFPLRFDLVLRRGDDETALLEALAAALGALGRGEIAIGARKARGYGRVDVSDWHVRRYDMTGPAGLLDWLDYGSGDDRDLAPENRGSATATSGLRTALGLTGDPDVPDHRSRFALCARFGLDGSLLIRSATAPEPGSPDATHLHSYRPETGHPEPVLSGTSLGGALRARAGRIARTRWPEANANRQIGNLFGYGPEDAPDANALRGQNDTVRPLASRVRTREHRVVGAETGLVQHRVVIDRFTGGAYPGGLFDQRPAFGDDATAVTVEFDVVNPSHDEIGLLLLVLKDLWMGDLPLGGEQSVGRGRLRGHRADLTYRPCGEEQQTWTLTQESPDGPLVVEGDRAALESFVTAFNSSAPSATAPQTDVAT